LAKEIGTVTPRVESESGVARAGSVDAGERVYVTPVQGLGERAVNRFGTLHAKETQYFMRLCGKLAEFGGEVRGADQAQEADGEVA